MKYLIFLRQKLYIAILIVCGFAMLGSILGARKESKESVTVYGPVSDDTISFQESGESLPELAGYLPLAADQNKWYNFKYAVIFAGAGIVLYCLFMAVYLPLYQNPFFLWMRKKMGRAAGEYDLFIKL